MVHELLTGKRTVEEARHTSEQNTVAYNARRAAPYAERLLFEVPQGGTEDLDESHLSRSLLQQAAGKLKDAVTGGEEATDRRTPADPGAGLDVVSRRPSQAGLAWLPEALSAWTLAGRVRRRPDGVRIGGTQVGSGAALGPCPNAG